MKVLRSNPVYTYTLVLDEAEMEMFANFYRDSTRETRVDLGLASATHDPFGDVGQRLHMLELSDIDEELV